MSGEVNSIDEVIYLIEFIDNIKKPEQKLEELLNKLEQAQKRKEFIDNLFIPLGDDEFLKYLNLLTYPKNLLKFLDNRRNELENERARLSKMMDQDRKKIKTMIIVCHSYFLFYNFNYRNSKKNWMTSKMKECTSETKTN